MIGNADGLDVTRAVEVIVDLPGGAGRRGSGYRVTGRAVLTAGHAVAGASRVRVRCNADTAGEWTCDARVVAAGDDIAVLEVDRADEIPAAGYGRLRERDAVLACTGLGFPRFKLRTDGGGDYRDVCHLIGSAPVLSNRRSGTLEITVTHPPERDPDPNRSAWEGMSGAPVFAAGRLVAVVTGNHALEGAGRLEAGRIDMLFHAGAASVRAALGLPPRVDDLADVLPPVARSLDLEAQHAEVASIAPVRLLDRDEELQELTRFCSGPDRYAWWQAGPWAGKTALVSSFAVDPPDGVRVVSYFVTARLSGHADAAAFSASVARQLAALAERPPPAGADASGQLALLVTEAAEQCARRGERLLLLVDGLDEDQGTKPSIAALLPRRPPDDLRVLVMSRPHPGLPADVPGDHPLRHCRVRTLGRSPYARDLEVEAAAELADLIRSGSEGYEVVALITASGGGLTLADLADLTGRKRHDVTWHIRSVFGRSLTSRSVASDDVYLFAHETLRDTAEDTLAPELPAYRALLHAWADRYRTQGWPEQTPAYLFEPYGRLLAAGGDTDLLAELATDWRRHERMLARTRTDRAALTEVDAARRLLGEGADLTRRALLALERQRLHDRSGAVPEALAAAWARLGYIAHAAALSDFLSEEGLAEYGVALVEAGHLAEATDLARRRPGYDLLRVWMRLAARQDPDRLGPLVAEIAAAIGSMRTYSLDLALLVELLDLLRPYPQYAATVADQITALLERVGPDVSPLFRLNLDLALAWADPGAAGSMMEQGLRHFAALGGTDRVNWAATVIRALVRTAAAAGPSWAGEHLTRAVDRVLGASGLNVAPLLQNWVRTVAALAQFDPARGLAAAKACLDEFDWQADPRRQEPDLDAWADLTLVIARTADPAEAWALLDRPDLPAQARVLVCQAMFGTGGIDDPDAVADALRQAAALARHCDDGPRLLADLALIAARSADHAFAAELASEAERAARAQPTPGQWKLVEEDLTRALIRLDRLRDAQDVLLRGQVSASLRADLALAHRLTSPQDTLRLLEGIDHAGRWRDTDGRKLGRIGVGDLAKASAALADIRPERSERLARRAVERAWGRTDATRLWHGMVEAVTYLPAGPAGALVADLVEALEAPGAWTAAMRYQLARALLRTDRRRAAELAGEDDGSAGRQDEIARLAVLAVVDPGGAAALAERLLRPGPDPWTRYEIAAALLGEPAVPAAAALRPLARSCVIAALDSDQDWSATLPLLADLEPDAVLAVHRRLGEWRSTSA